MWGFVITYLSLLPLPSLGNKKGEGWSRTRNTKHSTLPDCTYQSVLSSRPHSLSSGGSVNLYNLISLRTEMIQTHLHGAAQWFAVRKGAWHTSPDCLDLSITRCFLVRWTSQWSCTKFLHPIDLLFSEPFLLEWVVSFKIGNMFGELQIEAETIFSRILNIFLGWCLSRIFIPLL